MNLARVLQEICGNRPLIFDRTIAGDRTPGIFESLSQARHTEVPGVHPYFVGENLMKKILTLAASIAALSVAGTASAVETAGTNQQVAINANVASKCGISAQSSVITLGDLTGADAKIRGSVTQEIATALNNANIIPFCNASNSSVEVQRAVLARVGGGTNLTDGGFAQVVRYNLDASIDSLALDSTSVEGPSVVTARFGGHVSASDTNTHLSFAPASSNGTAVATSGTAALTAVSWPSQTDRRLAAGNYTGSVNVILTPGA